MTQHNHLKLSSVAFAAIWTVAMIAASADYGTVNIVILSVAGVLVGVGWYYTMRWFQTDWLQRTADHR